MPTTRRRITHRMTAVLTPHACAAWAQGGKHACHAALDIMPWDHSPFHVTSPEPPDWLQQLRGTDLIADEANWARAWKLRKALIAAAGPPGRFDQHGRPLGAVPPERNRS
jgi:hypothetical protein